MPVYDPVAAEQEALEICKVGTRGCVRCANSRVAQVHQPLVCCPTWHIMTMLDAMSFRQRHFWVVRRL